MLHSSTGAIWCRCTRHHVFIRLCQLITADCARAVFVKDPVRRIGLGVGSVFPNGAFHKWMGTQIKWFISWKIMENPSINGWFGPPAIRKPPEKYILPTWRLPSTHPPQCTFSCRGKSPSGTKSTAAEPEIRHLLPSTKPCATLYETSKDIENWIHRVQGDPRRAEFSLSIPPHFVGVLGLAYQELQLKTRCSRCDLTGKMGKSLRLHIMQDTQRGFWMQQTPSKA